MRVLHVVSSFPGTWCTGGTFYRNQISALAARGVECAVLAPEIRPIRTLSCTALAEQHWQTVTEMTDGFMTCRLRGWNVPAVFRSAWFSRECEILFRKCEPRLGKPDLVHGHNTFWAGMATRALARRLGVPYAITEHSSDVLRRRLGRGQRRVIGTVLRHASAVISVSSALGSELRDLGAEKVEVVPNVVDTGFFQLPSMRRNRGVWRLLFAGNLIPLKRVDLLLDAFAAFAAGRADVDLEVAGEGRDRRELEMRAVRLGIADRVLFLGSLSREGMRAALHRADCLVLPSDAETFGVVLIEALATGLPVIATDCGGPRDIVSRETGRLLPVGDRAALQDALSELHRHRNDFAARCRSIRSYACEHFGPVPVAEKLVAIYSGMVGKG